MATYLADRVIVFEGKPSVDTTAHTPEALLNGMNRFLELLGITFRRDPNNFRPRINKERSVKVSSSGRVFELFDCKTLLSFRMLNKNALDSISSWRINHLLSSDQPSSPTATSEASTFLRHKTLLFFHDFTSSLFCNMETKFIQLFCITFIGGY